MATRPCAERCGFTKRSGPPETEKDVVASVMSALMPPSGNSHTFMLPSSAPVSTRVSTNGSNEIAVSCPPPQRTSGSWYAAALTGMWFLPVLVSGRTLRALPLPEPCA